MTSHVFVAEYSAPLGERSSLYFNGEASFFRGGMSEWEDFILLYNGTLPSGVALEWDVANDLSNISIDRLAFGAGYRYRSDGGYGLELIWNVTKYEDNDPYLEDETGSFNRVTALVSKSF